MRKIVVIIVLLLGFSSCMSADDVVIGDLRGVEIVDMSNIELTVEVENKSRRQFELRDIEITLLSNKGGKNLMKLLGSESVFIPKRSRQEITIPLRINVLDVISLLGSGFNQSDMEKMVVRGEMSVKSGFFKKQIEFAFNVSDHIDNAKLPNIGIGALNGLFN